MPSQEESESALTSRDPRRKPPRRGILWHLGLQAPPPRSSARPSNRPPGEEAPRRVYVAPPPEPAKPKKPLPLVAGFKDPVRRPRYLIWTGTAVSVLAAVMIVALGVTSTRWFCAEACHKVQDDAIEAYARSSHSEISCMACHMPPNANPVIFVLHKAEALGELYLTVTNQYELPLNRKSHVAKTMAAEQCTQCHDPGIRTTTPSPGLLIDHAAHAEAGVSCTLCHNRIAHRENFDPKLVDPATGEKSVKHVNFMTMSACFRCHTQNAESPGLKAPGKCLACHPKNFELKPASHLEGGFYPKGHAKLAKAEKARLAVVKAAGAKEEGGEAAEPEAAEGTESAPSAEAGHGETIGETLIDPETIDYCSTCHSEKFCTDCHGVPMPHPADFKKGHGQAGKRNPKACARCHGNATRFCDECHHGSALKWEYQASPPWRRQHPTAVKTLGSGACFDCHKPTYCSHCHVRGKSN